MPAASGIKQNSWILKTPPGTSEFHAYRDETADPPALVVQVGKTELRYHLRCLEDLHAMLKAHGDWMLLGTPTNKSRPTTIPSKPGHVPRKSQSEAGTVSKKASPAASPRTSRGS